MLRTRLIVGSLMAAAAAGVLYADEARGPRYPGLLLLVTAVGAVAAREVVGLLPAAGRPRPTIAVAGTAFVLAANWARHRPDAVPLAFAVVVLAAFVAELFAYAADGRATTRIAHTAFVAAYLGLLPAFLVKLRWLPTHSGLALALAIAVPKCGDIGAYSAGRLFGRTPMSPRISPKKTWEGFAGGTLLAVAAAVGLGQMAPIFPGGTAEAAGFGLVVGWAGVAGDLAASMLKRDAAVKDASAAVPGFGGVVDVVDSVVFAGPVAYLWLTR